MKILKLMMAVLMWGSLHAQEKTMETVMKEYLQLKDVILAGDPNKASTSADKLVAAIEGFSKSAVQDQKNLLDELVKISKSISSYMQIEKQRGEFGKLSESLWNFIKESNQAMMPLYYNYCPMKKAYWISDSSTINNPFYGKQMLTCGKTVETIDN